MVLFDLDNEHKIPMEMRQAPQWVNWRYEERKGAQTKVPVNPHTGRHASSTNPKTWGTFGDACANVGLKGFCGIGFVLTPPWIGIDLDKCLAGGTPTLFARAVLARYAETYAEYSPSGAGVHILCQGEMPTSTGVNRPQGEMYAAGRFFTVTGSLFPGHPSRIWQAPAGVLAWTLAQLTGDTTPPASVPAGTLDIDPASYAPVPALQLDRLLDGELQRRQTWEHKRKFKSASEYEMALARYCITSGWSDQETYNLLVDWRLKHGLEEKHTGALLHTISKAHGERIAAENDKLLDTLDMDSPAPEETRKGLIRLLGLDILRVLQIGKHDAVYRLELADGSAINLGTHTQSRKRETWEKVITEQTESEVPITPKQWGKYRRVLFRPPLMVYVESPDTTEMGETRQWVDNYMSNADTHADDYESVRRQVCFRTRGQEYLHLDALLLHVHIHFSVRILRSLLANRLEIIGFVRMPIERTDETTGETVRREYYVRKR